MTACPAVQVNPAVNWGRPAMKGISTELLGDMYWAHGEAEVEADYELSRHELLVALWFEGTYGQPRFRRRWKAWAQQAGVVLWHTSTLDPGGVGLPPCRPDG